MCLTGGEGDENMGGGGITPISVTPRLSCISPESEMSFNKRQQEKTNYIFTYFLQEYTFFEKDDTHHCVGCDHWG